MTLRKITLIGHVGDTPCFQQRNGEEVCALFPLVIPESWRYVQDRWRLGTTWYRVLVFSRPLVEVVKHRLTTGTAVFVEGMIREGMDQEGVSPQIVLQEPYGLRVLPKEMDAPSISGSSGEESACPPPTPEGEKMSEGESP